ETENLPETNLRIFLRGVMAADGEYPASALIEGSDGKTEVYVSGDELPGNAELRSVFPNRVVLERSGKLENLYFPETDDNSGLTVQSSQSAGAASTPDTAGSSTNRPDARPTPSVTPTPANADERREQIRQRLEQLRERLKANSN
ncbi:MAG: type II secretion system protein N, partial [Marinobacter sp.]|nr:type II secretion system protein N [Marinobacter sp.]